MCGVFLSSKQQYVTEIYSVTVSVTRHVFKFQTEICNGILPGHSFSYSSSQYTHTHAYKSQCTHNTVGSLSRASKYAHGTGTCLLRLHGFFSPWKVCASTLATALRHCQWLGPSRLHVCKISPSLKPDAWPEAWSLKPEAWSLTNGWKTVHELGTNSDSWSLISGIGIIKSRLWHRR